MQCTSIRCFKDGSCLVPGQILEQDVLGTILSDRLLAPSKRRRIIQETGLASPDSMVNTVL